MRSNVFILVPAAVPTGPVKGAYALANALVGQRSVTLVTIKKGTCAQARLDPRIRTVCLADYANNAVEKLRVYRALLVKAGARTGATSLSLGFSADLMNVFCKKNAFTCSSVRGNLLVNYRHDYGLIGPLLAVFHLILLRWVDKIVSMNNSMARQIFTITGRKTSVIGNFIDEEPLSKFSNQKTNSGPYRFIFVGSLTTRKSPVLLVNALSALVKRGITAYVDFLGIGPEKTKIEEQVERLELRAFVNFHGFVNEPEKLTVNADVLVLPSLSEGVSRAAMEALYVGIPCVLRNSDGNPELVTNGVNGVIFNNDLELPAAMLKAAELSRSRPRRECLLPLQFRQSYAASMYMSILEGE